MNGCRITSIRRSATSSGATAKLGAVDQHDELVATHPSDRVGVAQGAGQPGGDGHQEPVAGLVTEGVVDVLEVVEVDEQRRPTGAVAAVADQQLLDAVHDQRPVRQPGQRIVEGLIAQLVGLRADEVRHLSSEVDAGGNGCREQKDEHRQEPPHQARGRR